MKGPKRLLSVLLAASLSVWCVPAGALAEEAPGASDGAAVSGTPSADATIGSSSAVDGAGTDAGTSQVATPAQPDAAVGASSAAPEAAQPAAAQAAAADEGGAAGEGETAGDESFEGVYVISAAANSKAVLSTAGSQFYSGANVELASANGTLFQRWRIEAVGEGYYTITSVATGKVLDVANGGRTPGTNVWQCTPFGNDAQKWKIARAADGSVTLVSKLSGLALDIADGLAVAGTNIQTYTVNGAPAQRFALAPVSDPAPEALLAAGVYEICAAGDTSYALDVADASLVSGADVRLWSSNYSQAQKWYIEPDSEGYYTIISMGSGLVLDVSNGGLTPGTNVWQCTPFGNSMQKWRLVDNGNGSFSLISKGNVLALDIADGICAAGTDVRTWTPNGAIAQSFVFSPCESTYADGTYELALSSDKGTDLDVFDASTESGANVQVHTDNGGYAQKWHVTTRDDGYCTIESLCSGKVLAVEGGSAAVGSNVCQQTADGTDSQLWKLVPLGNGAYRIASKSGEFALSLSGKNVVLGSSADASSFILKKTPIIIDGFYIIGAYTNPSVKLDVQDASRASGANVQLHTENGSNAQVVKISTNADGSYTIAFPFSRKVLDVANGGRTPGTNVWQCTPFGNDAQKWYPKYAGDQSFSFVCKGNGLALDIADGIAESGTNVQVYTRNNSIAQRFVLTPTTYVPDDFSDLLAHFSTVSTNTFNGWYNMSRALSNFDGMVVWPGETVSFFDTCGPCGAAEGYLIAGVVGGSGYGGGICQASTTLYGAVVRAGLTIVERQNHTTPSTYVPIGQDAMVNWGSSDFRFRNDWDFPVKIVVDNYDRTLNCDIWGIQPDWYDYIDVSSWWTGSHSAAAQREYYKDGVIVATSALPNSWYW